MFSLLIANSNSPQSLSDYITNNSSLIDEFVDSSIETLRKHIGLFEEFVLLGSRVKLLDALDFSISQNRAFIAILFDYAERVNESSIVLQLYQIIERHNLDVGSRIKASMLYLYNVPNNQVYIDRFDDICSKLQLAIDEEDDNERRAVATFLNYYSSVVYNTSPHVHFVQELQSKVKTSYNKYPFLRNNYISTSISLDVNQAELVYPAIQTIIDELLYKRRQPFIPLKTGLIIESNTDYSRLLSNTPKRFDRIRDISTSQLDLSPNRDEVFYSLSRGVAILEQEEQLYSYMNSYGLMHKAKLVSAFSNLPFGNIKDCRIELFDWSCGQGIASIVLFEFLRDHNIHLALDAITLIEPSRIALERASLHVLHFLPNIKIRTILKDMDSLANADIETTYEKVKIHMFSNILDVEAFSMVRLINLLNQTSGGLNYFICVSPYINDLKTARFESFVNGFSKNEAFDIIHKDAARRGEWKNNWTKLINIFSVMI